MEEIGLSYVKLQVQGYYSKKNSNQMARSKKTGRFFPVPSQAYRKWEKKAIEYLVSQRKVFLDAGIELPIAGYRVVFMRFYYNRGRHSDFNNASHGICDALEKAGIFENDRYVLPYPILPNPFVKSKERKIDLFIILSEIQDLRVVLEKTNGKGIKTFRF